MNRFNSGDVVYGFHPVSESLEANIDISKIFLDREKKFPKDFLDKIIKKKIPISYVPKVKLSSFTKQNHQGIVAVISPIKFFDINKLIEIKSKKDNCTFLGLNGLTDIRNIGAIVRTAECVGVDAIIIDYKCGMINSDCMKSSAGALANVPICRVKNFDSCIKTLKEKGVRILGCSEKGNKNIFSYKLDGSIMFIMGNEEKGIEKKIIEMLDDIVYIPMKNKISSLNVSVASAIFLYENFRQNFKN